MLVLPTFNTAFIILLSRGYILFELCIAFIQAFVFSLLCSQYLGEHA
jgi:F0F1-type ATP synthase membrane subunit a